MVRWSAQGENGLFLAENFGVKWLQVTLPFPAELHHCYRRARPRRDRFSALLHFTEPRQFKWPTAKVRANATSFDVILTNEEELLDLPNVRFCLFGSRWVTAIPQTKNFDVSFIYSNGIGQEALMAGYRARREIWSRKTEINIAKRFYTSITRPPKIADLAPYPYADKDPIFTSKYSIVVENDYQDNYFTEKLIDAVSTMTVPIYFGSPNIGRYFNLAGMIVPRSVDEMIEMVNALTPADYESRSNALRENLEASKPYWDFPGNLKRELLAAHAGQEKRKRSFLQDVLAAWHGAGGGPE